MMVKRLAVLLIVAVCSGVAVAADFAMPFNLPLAPEARFLLGSAHDSAAGDREESVSRYATGATPQEVISFYQQALEQAGFLLSVVTDNGDYAAFSGKRNRDRIRISAKRDGGEVEAGEVEITIVANYDK